ncbi:serine/threonine-protein kinase [Kitasatospora sp. NPDC050543]|uniref:serine/threonine-protein kinase n=1 Tax=Kitasatospora sp. NPDC050543 TaxID=3364054 RepID=UPI0037971D41
MNTEGPDARLIDGRFELLQRLGGGGMGLVWRARDNALHREVALKEVRPPDPAMAAADPAAARDLRERVLREARSLARLQHPNVAVIHHIVDTAEHPHPWIVMELVTGGSLADRLAREPLTVPEAARIGRGVLSALRAAHAAGIQHRDVKPGNVLLRPDGTPVLTDFGIAAMAGATALTATGSLIGSPEYIAPERIRGEEGNPSSDLWSLGMMLYVAVEGHHPLRRATTLATLAAVLDEPLPPPTRAGQLGPLLSALLARDPAARPTAEQLDPWLAAAEHGGAGAPTAAPAVWAPTFLDTPRPAPTPAPGPAGTGPLPFAHPGGTGPLPYPYAGGTGPLPYPHAGGTGPTDLWPPQGYQQPRPVAPSGRRRATVATLSVAAVALTAVLGWSLWPAGDSHGAPQAGGTPGASSPGSAQPAGTPAATSPGAAATGVAATSPAPATAKSSPAAGAPVKDLETPAGLRATVDALRPLIADSKIIRLVVYPEYAIADAPTASDPTVYDRITYRDGKTSRTPGGTITSNDKTSSLQVFDWEIVPGLLQKAQETLNVANPTSRYLIIGPDMFDATPSISVYLSSEYGSGYLESDTKGKVTRSFPRGS